MVISIIIAFIVFWMICGYISYRMSTTYYLLEYPIVYCSQPYQGCHADLNKIQARIKKEKIEGIIFGPVGLLVGLFMGMYKHGISVPTPDLIEIAAIDDWTKFTAELNIPFAHE